MKTHSRLKKFNGLPHELSGLDYTYDSEVEGGEVSYTPKGAQHEFIFRKDSSNIKELQKQDKLRSKREEGDRISDISFDAIAKELMLKESQQLASEGIDPFNAGKEVFATGGVNYMEEPDPQSGIPQIVDTPVNQQPRSNSISADQVGGYTAAVGGLASSLGQLGPEDPYYSQGVGKKDVGTQALESTTDSIVSAVPLVGQFYSAGKGISSGIEAGRDDARSKDNTAGAVAAAFGAGFVDPAGSWFDLAADEKNGTLTSGQHVGAGFLNILMPGVGDAYAEKFRKQAADSKEKQAGYNATLAERGLIPQSNEIVRNRTQTINRNGGVLKKKYSGKEGSVRNTDPVAPYAADPMMMAQPIEQEEDFYTPYFDPTKIDIVTFNSKLNKVANKPATLGIPYVDEPIDADTPYVPKRDMNNPIVYPEIGEYTTAPTDTTAQKNKFKFDPNMLASIAGGLGQMIPSIAYLAGDGKDYDRVKYPTYRPDRVSADLPLRENRDAFASAREAMRQQGKLDLGALSALATQEAKGRSGVRENVRNVNTGMMNDAQLKNIATAIQAMQDEAANKGQYQTNKQQALQNLTNVLAGTSRQSGMMSNDEIIKRKFVELYGENKGWKEAYQDGGVRGGDPSEEIYYGGMLPEATVTDKLPLTNKAYLGKLKTDNPIAYAATSSQNEVGENLMDISSMLPGTGEIMDVGYLANDLIERNWGNIGIAAAATALPFVGYGALKKAKNAYDTVKSNPAKLKSFTEEVKGELYKGRQNRKDIKEGNEWLKNWIEHPTTQNKIAADRERIMKETSDIANDNNVPARQANKYFKKLDEEFRGAAEFVPNSKEYPLYRQFTNLFDSDVPGMHVANSGVSNKHLFGKSDAILEKYDKDWKHKFDYDESWISRKLDNTEKIKTTVHEGTHDWVNNFLLNKSGKYNQVLNNVSSDNRNKYFKWKELRESNLDPYAGMSNDDAYLGYLTNPTEVHARIMEMRNHFNLSPDTKITPTNVGAMLKYYDPDGFSKVFDSDPVKRNEKLAKLFNNLYTGPASAVVGGAALQSQQQEPSIYQNGGVRNINNNDIGFLFNEKFGIQ